MGEEEEEKGKAGWGRQTPNHESLFWPKGVLFGVHVAPQALSQFWGALGLHMFGPLSY